MDILPLVVKVGTGEIDQLVGKLDQAKTKMESTQSVGYQLGYGLTEGFKLAVVGAAGLVTAIAGLTVAFASNIDNLNAAGEIYGYNATQISAMKGATEAASVSFADFTSATARANRELSNGGEAYKNLGISIRGANGELKSGSELATEVATKYQAGTTTAQQFADVQKVLGKDVDKTAQAIIKANEGLELANTLFQDGIGIVEGSTKAWDAYDQQNQKTRLTFVALSSIVVAKVLPVITELTKAFVDGAKEGGLVKLAVDGLIDSLPGLIGFGGTVAKVFLTAFNVVRAFGQTIGAAAAALVAIGSGDFVGAKNIAIAWKENIDSIDADNQRGIQSIEKVAQAAIKASKDSSLALQNQKSGKASGGGVDPVKRTPIRDPQESNIVGKINAEADAIIKLKSKIAELNGVSAQTNLQLVEQSIARGDYDAKLSKGVVVRLAATAAQLDALRAGATEQDQLIAKAELLKRVTEEQKREEAASTSAWQAAIRVTEQVKEDVEINRIKIRTMQDFSATQDDVNLAVANYRLQLLDQKIALAELNPEAEAELNLLRAKRAELVALRDASADTQTDNTAETERQRTFEYGWSKAFAAFKRDATDASKTGETAFSSFTSNAEGAIVQLLSTGKLNFKQFAASIVQDLIRIIAKQAVLKALGFAFGTSNTISGTNISFADGLAGGITALATGTNNVPYDNFPALLHKGEAVVPAQYNPAAGGKAQSSGLTIGSINVTVQGGATNSDTGKVVSEAIQQQMAAIADSRIGVAKQYGGMLYA